ncbi:glutaredoxin family protein [Meiothermus rufus]|uniref:glutaredoxin family protein n=1 Tax=Meiothermus rufus TaxID=604332 RepID=UPI0004108522|nr:glutaredoxin family protein [Meiothermus rufus]
MLILYSTPWCGDCKALKQALATFNLPYREINIDQHPEAEQEVLTLNNGRRGVPTLVYAGQAASFSGFSVARLRAWLQAVGIQP